MKKIIFVTLVAVLAGGFLSAENLTLTVDEAVDLAVSRNLGLKQQGIDLRTRERSKDKAWNAFLPSIAASTGVSANHSLFDFDYSSSSAFSDAGNLGINAGLSMSLPLNVGVGGGISNLMADYEAGLIEYEDAQKQLERDVRKQFYSLLANEENIRIQESNLELAQKRYEQARSNFENGLAPELEVLSAEVTVANLRPALDGVAAGYESQLLYFKFLLGIDRNDELELVGELETELYDIEAEDLISRYMAGRLDLRGLDKQLEAIGYLKKGTALRLKTPTLSLGYSWGLSGSNADSTFPATTIEPWSDWADRGTLSLGLQWQLDGFIPGSSTDVQLKELQDAIDSLTLAKQMAIDNAGIEITNAVNNLATARRTIEATTSSVELARRNYELTEEAYQVGTRELLDVESAQNDYLAATQQLLVAKYKYIAGLLDLEYALNAPRDEFLGR
ncbi:MAG: TolC family protein [Spirochaetaceae bacterium]|nr:TolC family protein [Spirochaetaceae bacterium]MDT8297976.1 TolC family protein [Spirochaetaceae bacterium]